MKEFKRSDMVITPNGKIGAVTSENNTTCVTVDINLEGETREYHPKSLRWATDVEIRNFWGIE
jgi:predicted amidohydrolase